MTVRPRDALIKMEDVFTSRLLLAYRDESGPAPSFRSHGIDH